MGSVDGGDGGGEGPVQRVVEDRRSDVGHDGVQQGLTQVLLLGGHRGGWGRRLEGGGRIVTHVEDAIFVPNPNMSKNPH